MQVVLVSGLSGSGKSIAIAVLEDVGYYCVDNLPLAMLQPLVGYLQREGHDRIAIAIDARSSASFTQLPPIADALRNQGADLRVIFLEAKTLTLVQRFSETRRRHPLSSDTVSLQEAIQLEREMLADIAPLAHRIDTSDLSASALRLWIKDLVGQDRSRITLLFESFGFKHGIPLDADLVFDVRCLPNPHYVAELRPLTGRDQPVKDFLEDSPNAMALLADIRGFVENWLPCFIRDHRAYLTVAIGCTGGQHRSVYFAETLAAAFREREQVLVRHRELS
ncbi:MAG: RNase adapter RapZ [Thiobacillus sp.]|uniref:RNase adapter RapZ n=1 Tax=unclassified Thiobacillus TaxID=2646513 RepID=UPI00086E629D|nr:MULTISPECIES: RNase adapter RapZ [unclassified Thiobacillus]MBS0311770.1 RNase adapter RapZ [Pseudomonadota bacterium]MBN8770923.1 RNase adapter RapZ [Thiobacillus sp.]MBN8779997.1 RNase adapter RapZ [Thiobacillus sp.]ODV00978.1 MAG: RNase adaptor protein RapZ [Thiobacillus sp. SCN 63-57]OJY56101.1 MAG: RNase adaptor protein RapZ [Thiobacillus sp. 0-1251]